MGGAGCTDGPPALGFREHSGSCAGYVSCGEPQGKGLSESGCCGQATSPCLGCPLCGLASGPQLCVAGTGLRSLSAYKTSTNEHSSVPEKDPMGGSSEVSSRALFFPRVSICQTEGEWLFKCLVQPEKYQTLRQWLTSTTGKRFQPVCRATRAGGASLGAPPVGPQACDGVCREEGTGGRLHLSKDPEGGRREPSWGQ